jgi:hypothetical protein
MDCSVCGRPYHPQNRPFLCVVDARNALYEHRYAVARDLMKNEQLERETGQLALSTDRMLSLKIDEADIIERTNALTAQAEKLRADIESARKTLLARKSAKADHSEHLKAAEDHTQKRPQQTDELKDSGRALSSKWDRSSDQLGATRSFLCMEAARLYGLRRIKKPSTVCYELGGIEILDLQAMGGESQTKPSIRLFLTGSAPNASPDYISTSLAHISHILVLTTHYMSLRLPAEIILPHRDSPRPTIYTLQSSYKQTGDTAPANTSPPRPRPLYIEKSLATLAKDDPLAHKMFIEGVALLAYNVAWACCAQNVKIGDITSFDDVLSIGRNLYNLLIGSQLSNNPAKRLFPASGDNARSDIPQPSLGHFSHGTTHDFLGDEVTRRFRLPNPKSITDKIKSKLSSDGQTVDWELLNDDSWAGEETMEAGVQVARGQTTPGQHMFGVESVATVATVAQDSSSEPEFVIMGRRQPESASQARGGNGWMRIRPR